MSKRFGLALATFCVWIAASTGLQAADTLPLASEPSEKAVELQVTLSNGLDNWVLTPDKLRLEAGKTYKMLIKNPSSTTHYFWAPELASHASRTLLLSVDKGMVRTKEIGEPGVEYLTWDIAWEIEVQPGGTAVWTFVPDKPGLYKWGCSQLRHADAGMVSELEVTRGQAGG